MGKPLEGRKTRCSVGPCRAVAIAICAIPLSLLPVVAGAVETDRITVEDPGTGAIKFKVTSEGNVTAARYVGDGAGLSNVAHWKGTWSSATAYAKDDCVYYSGSSWIALQPSSNAQPNVNPVSWTVMAQQGAAGAAGTQGPQGIEGPAGSPDTQTQILGKLSTQTDGAVLTLLQGSVSDTANTVKFAVADSAGVPKVVATPGAIGIGVATPDRPLVVDSSSNTLAWGNSSIILQGDTNKERFEIRSFGTAGMFAPTFMGLGARGTKAAPSPVGSGDILFLLSGFGWNGTAFGGTNPAANSGAASVIMNANETHTTTAKGSYIDFQTTANGTTTRSTKLRIGNDGKIGVGTTAPTQKLELKDGGMRINNTLASSAKPACDATSRGTFWITQGGTSVADTLEVCMQSGSDTYVWRTVLN